MGKIDLSLDNSPDAYVPCDPLTMSCGFMVGPNSDYITGHVMVWVISILNSAGPFLLYWLWKKPQFA